MDTKKLRQKILDLAIRGKLVPQDPNDEPASVLLERIREEKKQMVKEGKLKAKDIKNDTIIFKGEDNLHYEKFQDGTVKCIEDEIPFEVPKGWEWARLQSISSILTDGTHKTPTYSNEGVIFLSSKNVTSGKINWEDIMYIPESLHNELYARLAPQVDDILLAKNGTTGVAAIVDRDCVFDIYVSLGLIRIVNSIIFPRYILYAIGSTFIQEYFNSSLKGIGVPNLHLEHIRKTLVPIPTMKEQKLIVDKIEAILPYTESVDLKVTDLKNIIDKTKSKILGLAIRGKLVPQNPNDEPASVLLERIRVEKEGLIKQGKLKRDKKESIIYKGDDNSYYEQVGSEIKNIDDEIPFDIPDNWTWCRLKSLTSPIENAFVDGPFGSNLKTEHYTTNREVRIVQLNNIGILEWKNTGKKYTTYTHADTISRCISKPGDLVIAKMMPAGRAIILPDIEETYVISSDCVRLSPSQLINSLYLLYIINSNSINSLILKNVQGIGRTRTSLGKLKEVLVPIPPFPEQTQIVNKIQEFYSLINNIEHSIE